MSIIEELKRRNVARTALLYIVASWLTLQVADVLFDAFDLPSKWVRAVFAILILGFPVTLIVSWAYGIAPEGLKREKDVDRSQSVTTATGRKINILIVALLVLAIGTVALDRLMPRESPVAESVAIGSGDSQIAAKPKAEVPESAAPERSIAVLPFANRSGDENDVFFVDGIHDDILTQLAKIASLKVVSRTSVMGYRDTTKNMKTIGEELGVAKLLEGGVQRAGNGMRINVKLVDADTDESLWAETYDRELTAENIFAIQREMATSIAWELQATLSLQEVARLGVLPTQSTTAYDLYFRGRYFQNLRTKEGVNRALDYFSQAIKEDPNYALAYAGVASIYVLMGNELYAWSHPRDSYPKAQAAALRALELDDSLAEAHSVLGDTLLRYEWDFPAADREHKLAIALNPNYATGHQWYSHYLLPMGRDKESLAHSLRALELDPLNLIINLHLGWHYFYVGENQLAIEQLRQTLELNPAFVVANLLLGQVYEQEMRLEEAIEQFERAADLSDRNPVHLAALAHAYGISGRQKDAETLLGELLSSEKFVPSYEIAVIYAGLDRQDEALTWLERAYDEKDSSWIVDVALDPRFQQLHSASRFQSLTQRLGLP
ncbi:MAG: tetratricopeptide repeat protein [Gammaproteobacteria bacterium]|nr:tetratricopeptide repeat protein [Gammaproteobacteria bacterium]